MRQPVDAKASWRVLWLFIAAMLFMAFILGEYYRASYIDIPSTIILGVISYVVWRIYEVRRPEPFINLRSKARIWLFVSAGFAFLALDEALSIHEGIDIVFHWLANFTETGLSDRADDLIVFLYGVAGLVIIYCHRSEFWTYRRHTTFLIIGFAFFLVMVGIDAIGNQPDLFEYFGMDAYHAVRLQRRFDYAEDIAKIIGECAFLIAFARVFEEAERASHTAPVPAMA